MPINFQIRQAREFFSSNEPHMQGVILHPLTNHGDDRGQFTELYREEWFTCKPALQWNIVKSNANVLRGLHVHVKHADYLTVVSGEMLLGLHDFRPESSTYKQSCFMLINEVDPFLVTIPVGVGHGFYFKKPTIHFYGVSEYFDRADEYGCMWNDKELNLDWPCSDPRLSRRDQDAMSYSELVNVLSKVEAQWL